MAGDITFSWNKTPNFLRSQIVLWSLLSIVAIYERRYIYQSLSRAIIITIIITPCMVLFTNYLRMIYDHFNSTRQVNFKSVSIVSTCCTLTSLFTYLLVIIFCTLTGWTMVGFKNGSSYDSIFLPLTQYFLIYSGWSLIYLWGKAVLQIQNEELRLVLIQSEKTNIELQNLRIQLNPHLLFNSLNGIKQEINNNPSIAVEMIENLSTFVRHSLTDINHITITILQEMEAVEAFLSLHQARFENNLKCTTTIQREALSYKTICFLLQPLVENAIKHGNRDNGLEININISILDNKLKIDVQNTGTLKNIKCKKNDRDPIGLQNLEKRLAIHYPNRHQFKLYQHNKETVCATLLLDGDPC
jgi:sensor histidine kinase YesM